MDIRAVAGGIDACEGSGIVDVIESSTQTQPVPWWQNLRDDVCVLQCNGHASLAEATITFVGMEHLPDGSEGLCFDLTPPCCLRAGNLPESVRLIVLTDTSSTIFHLRMVAYEDGRVRVLAEPLSIQRRYLRRAPRVSYHLGPYPAVVHGADKRWRGVLELRLRDVSEYGVGFKAELGRAYVLRVGDLVRCPIVLPDGRRTWIEGRVTWLGPDGSGGIATREPPVWLPAPAPQPVSA